jgi:hypothetical protein
MTYALIVVVNRTSALAVTRTLSNTVLLKAELKPTLPFRALEPRFGGGSISVEDRDVVDVDRDCCGGRFCCCEDCGSVDVEA